MENRETRFLDGNEKKRVGNRINFGWKKVRKSEAFLILI